MNYDGACRRQHMTDSTKTVVWKWQGDAYGLVGPNENPDGDSVTDKLDLRFSGYVYDSETGLYCSWFRCYDPLTGRFTQADRIGPTRDYSDPVIQVLIKNGLLVQGMGSRYRLNQPFAYVEDDPVNYFDPNGLDRRGPDRGPADRRGRDSSPSEGRHSRDGSTGGGNSGNGGSSSCPAPDDGCKEEIEQCSAMCTEAQTDPDRRHVYGGSMTACMKSCVSERCGGDPKWKGYLR